MALFESTGILHFGFLNNESAKAVIWVDKGISEFYSHWVKKYIKLQKPLYDPHVTIIRNELPLINQDKWGEGEGKLIKFYYSNIVHNGTQYFWLNVYSKELEEIRKYFGLNMNPKYPVEQFPEIEVGFQWTFHLTLANVKFY